MKKTTIVSLTLCTFAMLTFAQERGGGCVPPNNPTISGPPNICLGETASLTATSNGDGIFWFDAAVGGNEVGDDPTFVTGSLSQTTTYWAEAWNWEIGNIITGGARVAPAGNSSGTVNTTTAPWGLVFDASEEFVLNSVDVFLTSVNSGTLTVELKDENFNIVDQVTVTTPAGNSSSPVQFTVNLDFDISAGTGWRLVASQSPPMVREFSSGHPGFPYPLGNVGSVTQGTINDSNTSNPGLYYFFYNWSFTPYDFCASDREEFIVEVTETPIPEGDPVQEYVPGETLIDFDVTGVNLTWYQDEDGNVELPDNTPIVEGVTYYVSQTIDDCESELLSITGEYDLSISDRDFSSFKYYPNPFINELRLSNITHIEKVVVYSVSGQLIQKIDVNSGEIILHLNDLDKGVYLLEISTKNAIKIVKVVKQ